MPIGKEVVTKDYVRIQRRKPSEFFESSFRTHDMGRAGYSKRIAGISKKSRRWETQSYLISRNEPKYRADKLLFSIEQEFKRNRIPFSADRKRVLKSLY